MVITSRSKRVSAFGNVSHTPSSVGPGSYAPEKVMTTFKEEVLPAFSGFATSEKRKLNENKSTSAMTPGPGAYSIEPNDSSHPPPNSKSSLSKTGTSVFTTKISRFAPSAPGSTIYRPSTIQDNPGPGAYSLTVSDLASSASSGLKRGSNNAAEEEDGTPSSMKFLVQYIKPSVPTIPKKEQSYGYVQVGDELKRQPQPANIYSGIGHDTVGPAAYSGHGEIWDEKRNAAASLKSTVKRGGWENAASSTPRGTSLPGPGSYAGTSSSGRKSKPKESAVFASKVPILPGPKVQERNEGKEQELLVKQRRLEEIERQQKLKQSTTKVKSFGSRTGRIDLCTTLDAPYSNPTSKFTPGPGQYSSSNNSKQHMTADLSFVSSSSAGMSYHKKKSHRDENVGFSSASERHCLAKTKVSSSAPGPGAYNAESPRSMECTVKSKVTVGRHGIFGSTSERVVWDHVDRVEPDAFTPGPGAYEKTEVTSGHVPYALPSAAFKSTSTRFHRTPIPNDPSHVYAVEDTTVPAVGQYDISRSLASSSSPPPPSSIGPQKVVIHGGVITTQEPVKASAPFLTTSERTSFLSKQAVQLPGPGTYGTITQEPNGTASTRSNDVRTTIGNDRRFKEKPILSEHIGPGAYSMPSTMGSKSFNVTLASNESPRGNIPSLSNTNTQQTKSRTNKTGGCDTGSSSNTSGNNSSIHINSSMKNLLNMAGVAVPPSPVAVAGPIAEAIASAAAVTKTTTGHKTQKNHTTRKRSAPTVFDPSALSISGTTSTSRTTEQETTTVVVK